jgi:hypothetical protein
MTLRSPDLAEARARYTIDAAQVFLSNASAISDHCNWAQEDEVVLAVVKRDLIFAEVVIVPLNRLRAEVMSRVEVGWTLVFSPGTTDKDIEARCNKMVELARARLDAIKRWREKHQSQYDE